MRNLAILLAVAAVSVWASGATAAPLPPIPTGNILFEHFDGQTAELDATDPDWDTFQPAGPYHGQIVLDGTTLGTINESTKNAYAGSRALDFSGSPDEWVATVRFRVDGTLYSTSPTRRLFLLLSGRTSGNPARDPVLGVDFRLQQIASDPNGTASTFDMKWYGPTVGTGGSSGDPRTSEAIAGASGLNKGQFYELMGHRKPNDTVDIWLDGTLIDTKTLSATPSGSGGTGVGITNPDIWRIGLDADATTPSHMTYDLVGIGSLRTSVPVGTGEILAEEFDGTGPLPTGGNWARIGFQPEGQTYGGVILLNGDGTAVPQHNTSVNRDPFADSKQLDFSNSADEWVASVRFKVEGTLDTYHSGGKARTFELLSGRDGANAQAGPNEGVDLRLQETAGDTGGTGPTFDMTWDGWNGSNGFQEATAINGAVGLNKDQFYTVTAHRTPDDLVDIYLDGILIDTKALLSGVNPDLFRFGEATDGLVVHDGVTFDFIRVGPLVPEPSSLVLLVLGICGLAGWRWRRRAA